MTYYRDALGHELETKPETGRHNEPVVTLLATGAFGTVAVRIPADRIEGLIAGLRDTARQAAAIDAATDAHNAGPTVRECARDDAAHWNDKYAGEGQ